MKRKRYSEEQIVRILEDIKGGQSVAEAQLEAINAMPAALWGRIGRIGQIGPIDKCHNGE